MVIILIDLDGTLIVEEKIGEERTGTVDLKGQMIDVIKRYNFADELLDSLISVNRSSLLWNAIMALLNKLEKSDETLSLIRNELDAVLARHERKEHEISSLSEETIPFLKELRKGKYTLIMLTNTSRFELRAIFSKYSLSKYFSGSITRDDVIKIKPDPEGIVQILDKFGEDSFVLIDDLDYGVLATNAARKLGYRGYSILVNRGRYSDEILKQLNPDAIVNSLLEIPELLKTCLN